jgi:superfamily I DNA and/or RNA helicase
MVERVRRRARRLERLATSYAARMAELREEMRHQEDNAARRARLVLATMTNVYLSSLLRTERFDVIVVEEAGMAVLPVLFYCAALAAEKVVLVGDPRQLPPIVQSRDRYVRQAMGRDIFSVAVADPLHADIVVMLNVQYRMYPAIGGLVSRLFYEGELDSGPDTHRLVGLVRRQPFPGESVIVVDTDQQTSCAVQTGGFSRLNQRSARLCVDLALAAVRDGVRSIGIITPYVAQARLVRQILGTERVEADAVACSTVHRFQGHEKDFIFLDAVDAAPLPPGILLDDRSLEPASGNLLNVSISRARAKLIIVADVQYFRAHRPTGLISRMLEQAVRAGTQIPMDSALEKIGDV